MLREGEQVNLGLRVMATAAILASILAILAVVAQPSFAEKKEDEQGAASSQAEEEEIRTGQSAAVRQGQNRAFAENRPGRNFVRMCDGERDASLGYTRYRFRGGGGGSVFDGNGASPGCGVNRPNRSIRGIKACETNGVFPDTCVPNRNDGFVFVPR